MTVLLFSWKVTMTLLDERQLSAQGQNVMVVLDQCSQQHAGRLPTAITQLTAQGAQQRW